MNSEFFNALDQLEKEKGIPKEYMLERVEAALISAYKRDSGGYSNVRVAIDDKKKTVKLFQVRHIVEEVSNEATEISLEDAKKLNSRYKLGGVAEIEVKTKNMRRLGAQAAKQVIIQGIREAERNIIINQYESKKEEIITAVVLSVDEATGSVVLDTGTSEAVMLKSEQIPNEKLAPGDRIKVYVTEVRRDSRGPIVTLTRNSIGFLKRLFELEVPEIMDGVVTIKGISREAGSRSKIAVYSRDKNVDPVGACIGAKGMRINQIVDELRGEKVDVIDYSDNPDKFIRSALSPAVVNTVEFDGERSCRVYVDQDQLSLAIGKEGQNARLAARLTGFKIDIKVK